MAKFERKVNYLIEFETPILIKYPKNKLLSYSVNILNDSLVSFNFRIKDASSMNVVFLYFVVANDDIGDFKEMTVSDIKNIIYNTVVERENELNPII